MGALRLPMTTRALSIGNEVDVSAARGIVREVASHARICTNASESLAIIVSELATNQLRYASLGRIQVREMVRDGIPGLEIEATDQGPGIADPTRAFAGDSHNGRTLGIGLAGVRRLALELDVDIRVGEGTRILARLFDKPVRRRLTVTIVGRPHPAERTSGDAAGFWRGDGSLRLVLSDGLGHGPSAREASESALAAAGRDHGSAPEHVLIACDAALRASRGAVLAIVHLDERGHLDAASVGNIEGGVCHDRRATRIPAQTGVVGGAWPRENVRSTRLAMPPGAVLLLATDGAKDPLAECGVVENAGLPPWALAQHILEMHSRPTDDAMVVVVK